MIDHSHSLILTLQHSNKAISNHFHEVLHSQPAPRGKNSSRVSCSILQSPRVSPPAPWPAPCRSPHLLLFLLLLSTYSSTCWPHRRNFLFIFILSISNRLHLMFWCHICDVTYHIDSSKRTWLRCYRPLTRNSAAAATPQATASLKLPAAPPHSSHHPHPWGFVILISSLASSASSIKTSHTTTFSLEL